MMLELQAGSVDRGASIRDYSQYPGEDEYLFVPMSFVAPGGPRRLETTPEGVLHVIPVSNWTRARTHARTHARILMSVYNIHH
jgi:hypothetical protein